MAAGIVVEGRFPAPVEEATTGPELVVTPFILVDMLVVRAIVAGAVTGLNVVVKGRLSTLNEIVVFGTLPFNPTRNLAKIVPFLAKVIASISLATILSVKNTALPSAPVTPSARYVGAPVVPSLTSLTATREMGISIPQLNTEFLLISW